MIADMSGDRPVSLISRRRVTGVVDAFLGVRPIVRFYGFGGAVLFVGIVSGYASDPSKGIALGIVAGALGMWAYLGLGVINLANR